VVGSALIGTVGGTVGADVTGTSAVAGVPLVARILSPVNNPAGQGEQQAEEHEAGGPRALFAVDGITSPIGGRN
jgi:hypothetical protein